MSNKPRNIIIDTDGASDDVLAILVALGAPEKLNILGITCVDGSVRVDQAARNVLGALNRAGRNDIPVYLGASKPLRGEDMGNDDAYGDSGMNGIEWPAAAEAQEGASQFLETILMDTAEKVTLVTMGPLTNIARLLMTRADLARKFDEVVIMGGCDKVYDPVNERDRYGNMTEFAEFNFHKDALAAHFVLMMLRVHHVPTTLMTMDGIQGYHQTYSPGTVMTPDRLALLESVDPDLAQIARTPEWLDKSKFGAAGAFAFDMNTTLYLLEPDLYQFQGTQSITVTKSGPEAGRCSMEFGNTNTRRLIQIPDPDLAVAREVYYLHKALTPKG